MYCCAHVELKVDGDSMGVWRSGCDRCCDRCHPLIAIAATHLSRYYPFIDRTEVVLRITGLAEEWVFVPSKRRGHHADWLKWRGTVGKTERSENLARSLALTNLGWSVVPPS